MRSASDRSTRPIDLGVTERRVLRARDSGPGRPPNCSGCAPTVDRAWPIWTAVAGAATCSAACVPAELAVWLTDPTQAPHGGESVVDLIDRVGGWLDSLTDRPRPHWSPSRIPR